MMQTNVCVYRTCVGFPLVVMVQACLTGAIVDWGGGQVPLQGVFGEEASGLCADYVFGLVSVVVVGIVTTSNPNSS